MTHAICHREEAFGDPEIDTRLAQYEMAYRMQTSVPSLMDLKGERMLEGRFDAEGKLSQHLKDVGLMLDLGHALGVPLFLSAVHRQILLAGIAEGRADQDNSCVIAILRNLAGIPFESVR